MSTFRYIYRVIVEAIQGFMKDECFYKSSALTFYTLLSIVPILALAFGIAKGFGLEEYLEKEVTARLLEQPEISHQIIIFAYSLLAHTHGGWIAIIGLISLLWTSIQLFSNVEHSLNVIWQVKTHRSYLRQFSDYLAMLIMGPIFFIASSAFSVMAIAEFNKVSEEISAFKALSPIIFSLSGFFPFIMNWILFTCIYFFLPNTKVKLRYALTAGILAGTAYQIVEWIYIHFQIGVANYGAIYGSFAALPLFMVWVNTSWTIVLAGAEIAYHMEITPSIGSPYSYQYVTKKQIGLWLAGYCADQFLKGNPPVSLNKIEKETGAALSTIKNVAQELYEAGILDENQQHCILIARNPEDIKIKNIFDALDKNEEKYAIMMSPQFLHFDQTIKDMENYAANSPHNKSLKEVLLLEKQSRTSQ